MSVFVISYDLNKAGQDYKGLYQSIMSCGDWIHPLDSTWLVSTGKTAEQVYDVLAKNIDKNDKILIIKADKNWHASLSQEVYEWLRNHL